MSRRLSLIASAWIASAGFGLAAFHSYEATPGRAGVSPARWPADSGVRPAPGRPTVVMAVHPRCPCTRASLATLGDVVRRTGSGASVRLLIYRPTGPAPGWSVEASRRLAGGVVGAELVDDPGGREAARFGLASSGAVAAFDAAGRLRFGGGLTPGRGVFGASAGAALLSLLLRGGDPPARECSVFGCPIASSP